MRQNRLTSALLAPALGLVLLATACSGHVPEPSVAHATPSASPSVEMGESGPILKEAAIPGLDVGVSTTESKDLQTSSNRGSVGRAKQEAWDSGSRS